LHKIDDVSTGLTTHTAGRKLAENISHQPRLIHAGPSRIDPCKRYHIQSAENSDTECSMQGTEYRKEKLSANLGEANRDGDGDGNGDGDAEGCDGT